MAARPAITDTIAAIATPVASGGVGVIRISGPRSKDVLGHVFRRFQAPRKNGKKTAMSWLAGSTKIINQGCVGHVPEILDGDFPHTQRGCDAQAWSASEILRVWKLLDSIN